MVFDYDGQQLELKKNESLAPVKRMISLSSINYH